MLHHQCSTAHGSVEVPWSGVAELRPHTTAGHKFGHDAWHERVGRAITPNLQLWRLPTETPSRPPTLTGGAPARQGLHPMSPGPNLMCAASCIQRSHALPNLTPLRLRAPACRNGDPRGLHISLQGAPLLVRSTQTATPLPSRCVESDGRLRRVNPTIASGLRAPTRLHDGMLRRLECPTRAKCLSLLSTHYAMPRRIATRGFCWPNQATANKSPSVRVHVPSAPREVRSTRS